MHIGKINRIMTSLAIAIAISVSTPLFAAQMTIQWIDRIPAKSDIRVKDLVDLRNTSESFLSKYGDIAVPTGSATVLDSKLLINFLGQHGLSAGDAMVSGPSQIVLERRNVMGRCESKIAEQLSNAISSQYKVNPSFVQVYVVSLDKQCADMLSVSISQDAILLGKDIAVQITGTDRLELPIQLTAKVDSSIEVPTVIATSEIAVGDEITAAKLRTEKKELRTPPGKIITDLQRFLSSTPRARVAIPSGTTIDETMVQSGPMLLKGDVVSIIASQPGLQVSAVGKLLDNAEIGGVVTVENIDSKKKLTGRLIDSKNVDVSIGSIAAQ